MLREERRISAEHLADLVGGPHERRAFLALGVGVLAGGERTVGRGQLADHVVERGFADRPVAGVAGERPGVDVDPRQLRVVVEHLLEVRHQPFASVE
jgi:hypothetical protein